MKKILLFLIAVCLAFFTSCEKDSDTKANENEIDFVRQVLGGCHNQDFSDLKNATEDKADTVEFTIISEDTLNVFVGINYICCAPFISEVEILHDTLIMEISDTCSFPYQSCYCRCMCYYTWDFQFIYFEPKEYYYKIKLDDPREQNTILFREGVIDLSE